MKRFENAEIGDLVYSRVYGKMEIVERAINYIRCHNIQFGIVKFNLFGKCTPMEAEPNLFYIDGDNLYATERPLPKLDWSKVPVDTKVIVDSACNNYRRYFAKFENDLVYTFDLGADSWTSDGETSSWSVVELAEPITIDGVTYSIGTKYKRSKE